MKSNNSIIQNIGIVILKIILSLAAIVIAWVMIHMTWDIHNNPENAIRIGIWIANKVLLFIAIIVTLAFGWGAYIGIALIWGRLFNRKSQD